MIWLHLAHQLYHYLNLVLSLLERKAGQMNDKKSSGGLKLDGAKKCDISVRLR